MSLKEVGVARAGVRGGAGVVVGAVVVGGLGVRTMIVRIDGLDGSFGFDV